MKYSTKLQQDGFGYKIGELDRKGYASTYPIRGPPRRGGWRPLHVSRHQRAKIRKFKAGRGDSGKDRYTVDLRRKSRVVKTKRPTTAVAGGFVSSDCKV